jgi:hypothetical protein
MIAEMSLAPVIVGSFAGRLYQARSQFEHFSASHFSAEGKSRRKMAGRKMRRRRRVKKLGLRSQCQAKKM